MKNRGENGRMKYAVNIYVGVVFLLVILLTLSGAVTGVAGDLLYYLAFMIPAALGLLGHRALKRRREEEAGHYEPEARLLSLSRNMVLPVALFVLPAVAVIFLVSLLTSLLLTALGFEGNAVEILPLWQMLIIHALIPPLLEELLFRYLPMKLLLPYSPRVTVMLSALAFAVIHPSFFAMPYAFAAGLIMMAADILCESVVPSLVIHFVNNLLSVLYLTYGAKSPLDFIIPLALLGSGAVSLIALILIYPRRLKPKLSRFSGGRGGEVGYTPMLLVAVGLAVGLLSLGS